MYKCEYSLVLGHTITLNSVPRGSGFRAMNERWGSLPVTEVRGLKALINSSITFFLLAATVIFLLLLNPSTRRLMRYQGTKRKISLELLKARIVHTFYLSSNYHLWKFSMRRLFLLSIEELLSSTQFCRT